MYEVLASYNLYEKWVCNNTLGYMIADKNKLWKGSRPKLKCCVPAFFIFYKNSWWETRKLSVAR